MENGDGGKTSSADLGMGNLGYDGKQLLAWNSGMG